MSDYSLEKRIEKAENNWQSDELSNPRVNPFGFFCYSDASAAIGGGVGMFTWFPDRISMLDFIAETLPYCPPGQMGLDWGSVALGTEAIINEMKLGSIDDSTGVQRLNSVLKTFSQIEWLGTLNELLSGDHPYATQVRMEFRDQEDEQKSDKPIQIEEQESFFEFLAAWGC